MLLRWKGAMGLGTIFGYIGLLLLAGLTSPSVGLLGELIVEIPSDLLSWLHMPAFALLCWLVAREFHRRGWPLPYAWGAGAGSTFVFGLWIEVLQGPVEGRVTTWEDLVIDALGIALAGAVETYRRKAVRPESPAPLRVPIC